MNRYGKYRYTFAVKTFPRLELQKFWLPVEILEEKGAYTQVRFMDYHADKRGPGSLSWVKTTSVKEEGDTPSAPTIETRLPYKD